MKRELIKKAALFAGVAIIGISSISVRAKDVEPRAMICASCNQSTAHYVNEKGGIIDKGQQTVCRHGLSGYDYFATYILRKALVCSNCSAHTVVESYVGTTTGWICEGE